MWVGFKVFFYLNELPYKKVKKLRPFRSKASWCLRKLVDDDF